MCASDFDDVVSVNAWRDVAPSAGDVARFIWYLDSGECEIDATLRDLTGLHDFKGRGPATDFTSRIEPMDWPQVRLAVDEAIAGDGTYAVEFKFNKPTGEVMWLAANGRVAIAEGGERVLIGVNYDVTDKHTELERANLVASEMNHRVKNILAIVSSIFRATARGADDKEGLAVAFLQRLGALTALNDVVLQGGGDAADLQELVDAVLRPVKHATNLSVEVAETKVNRTAAQTIALVIGELMTNAVKYGGLAEEGFGMDLSIFTEDNLLTLRWSERASYQVSAPTKTTGFGMQVLTGISASTFNGRPNLTWRQEGLLFTCEWPLQEMQPSVNAAA
ncbi:HWE histidine kinase domain-containing protein [Gymnodinialimonas sp. 2305UL16-5]|uniref:sensor histidine kinase n=1 Tax=Gymnodinialimonas mytili TaxID=3126503 RepID=UPI0030AC8321